MFNSTINTFFHEGTDKPFLISEYRNMSEVKKKHTPIIRQHFKQIRRLIQALVVFIKQRILLLFRPSELHHKYWKSIQSKPYMTAELGALNGIEFFQIQ